MFILRDLLDAFWTITEISLTARDPDGKFLHEWVFGEDIRLTRHMEYEQDRGRLTFRNVKVNHHGERTRNGPEIGWGVNMKIFPPGVLEAPVRHMSAHSSSMGLEGHSLIVDVEMQEYTVEIAKEAGS